MAMDALRQLLFSKCAKLAAADAILLGAIVQVESAWRPQMMRFEPNFIYLARPEKFALQNGITLTTERCLQRFSYGLAQIMGGTCRGLGFEGMLSDLLEPSLNLDYMLKYFEKYCSEYVYPEDKIAAYNAGSVKKMASGTYVNQGYVEKVLAVLHADPTWKAAQGALPEKATSN